MFNLIGGFLQKVGVIIGGTFIAIGSAFGGTPTAVSPIATTTSEVRSAASVPVVSVPSQTSIKNDTSPQKVVGTGTVMPSVPSTNSSTNLLIEKCKAENATWLAAWPALEQSIRSKVHSDYQDAVWSNMQQYKGVITAGDIASSTSNAEIRLEQQAVAEAKTKFDLAGSAAYQKCLSAI